VALALIASGAAPAPAAAHTASSTADQVIVRFRADSEPADRATARDAADAEFRRALPLSGMQLLDPAPGVSAGEAARRLERSEDVLYAEADATRVAAMRPSDSYFSSQWGLNNTGQLVGGASGTADADIDAPEAWNRSIGSSTITVGVIDSGVDYTHPDLSPNVARNPGESGAGRESNGVDDDSDGLVDDWHGWDWVQSDNDPADPNGHGTHVAGTLAARGNDAKGVAGVAWQAKLLPLRVLDANNVGRISDIVAAYRYAAGRQLPIVNVSLAGPTFSQAEYDAIKAASKTLFVVGAGNDGRDNDVTGSYPCNQPLPNVICVTASDQNDAMPSFASYGRRSVDLAAPGVNVLSTRPGGAWGFMSGTSTSTPHVAGTAALILARYPGSSVAALRAALLSSVDAKPGFAGRTVSGGRLNAARALSTPPSEAAFPPDGGVDPARAGSSAPAQAAAGADRARLGLSANFAKRTSLRTVLRRGLAVRTRCAEACSFRLELTIARASAAGLKVASPNVVVGKGSGRLTSAGSRVVRVRLSAHSRRLLQRVRPSRLTLRASATDPAGNKTALLRALMLLR
jgi:subtilisin family serine protease